jgi:hypothetical protein
LDDFLLTGADDVFGGASATGDTTGRGNKGLTVSKGMGTGYMETGSYGRDRREEETEGSEDVVAVDDRAESFDVLLSSRASDCND